MWFEDSLDGGLELCRSGNVTRGIEFVKQGYGGCGEREEEMEVDRSVLLLQLSLSCVAVVVIARDIYPTTLQRSTWDHFHSKTRLFLPNPLKLRIVDHLSPGSSVDGLAIVEASIRSSRFAAAIGRP